MVNTSDYMVNIEFTLLRFTSQVTKLDMPLSLLDRLCAKCDIEPPEHCIVKAWSNKFLETGSLFDRSRSGRPTERGDAINDVEKSVNDNSINSVRRLFNELEEYRLVSYVII